MTFKIGERIKAVREQKGFSQIQLATLLGISNSRMSNWELGVNRPDVDSLAKICSVLEVSADLLLDINVTNQIHLNHDELDTIQKYRCLNDEGQEKVKAYVDDLVNTGQYKKHGEPEMAHHA